MSYQVQPICRQRELLSVIAHRLHLLSCIHTTAVAYLCLDHTYVSRKARDLRRSRGVLVHLQASAYSQYSSIYVQDLRCGTFQFLRIPTAVIRYQFVRTYKHHFNTEINIKIILKLPDKISYNGSYSKLFRLWCIEPFRTEM